MTARRSTLRVAGLSVLSVLVCGVLGAASAGAATPGAAAAAPRSLEPRVTAPPQLPQPPAAVAGAEWLASQLTSQGFIPASGTSTPDFSATAQTVLALSAADIDLAGASLALHFLGANLSTYVVNQGADGPGQLALLILDAVALGDDPTDVAGTNLIDRLLATQQPSGPDAGLFGTSTQVTNFAAGNYQQGLALVALAASGVRGTAQVHAAVQWLLGQQCPDGGWTSPDNADNSCSGTPATSSGPDTNSTSLALQGLAAQAALPAAVRLLALGFLTGGQDADAGWSYYPNTLATPGVTDPDSTALVIQGLVAVGESSTGPAFTKGSLNPVVALLSFQLASGPGAGAFSFSPAPAPADVIATYQAVPALVGLPFGWGPSGGGYWEVGSDGGVFSLGPAAGFFGSTGGLRLDAPVVGMAGTPDGRGYWLVAADGGIFSFGDAGYFGSLGGTRLNRPVVGMAATPDGRGYWLVAADGGIFSFGDAGYFGSMGGTRLNRPVGGMAATPDGHGYWLVAADGGIFGFGTAPFRGSMGGTRLNQPVVGMAASPDGRGYWLVAADGGIFSFGDAGYFGSMGGTRLNKPVVGIAGSPDGLGYWEVAADGGIFTFGDAGFFGSTGSISLNAPVVGIAASQGRPVV